MIKLIDQLQSDNVTKFIYEDDDALVESVLYKYPTYEDRTTICISVQSGCRVGCSFCGTGKRFIRDLTAEEIVSQVVSAFESEQIDVNKVKRLQIMFMSMGEPTHNIDNVISAIICLNVLYPEAELLLSSIGTDHDDSLQKILDISKLIDKVGLQFSIHHYDDDKRNKLIPYSDKLSLDQIAEYGKDWSKATGRQVFCNYVVTSDNNTGYESLFELFGPNHFAFTFSVLCSKNETVKSAFINNKDSVKEVHDRFLEEGYNTRVFDPAGQDDIGGGCGQLWYFQRWQNDNKQ